MARLIYMQHLVLHVAGCLAVYPLTAHISCQPQSWASAVRSRSVAVGTWLHGAAFRLRCWNRHSSAGQASALRFRRQSPCLGSQSVGGSRPPPAATVSGDRLGPKFLASSALAACHVSRTKTVRIRVEVGVQLAASMHITRSRPRPRLRPRFQSQFQFKFKSKSEFSTRTHSKSQRRRRIFNQLRRVLVIITRHICCLLLFLPACLFLQLLLFLLYN